MGSLFGAKIAPWESMVAKMGPKSSQEPLFWPPWSPQGLPKCPQGPPRTYFLTILAPRLVVFIIKYEPMVTYFFEKSVTGHPESMEFKNDGGL